MFSVIFGSKGQYLVLLCLSIAYFLENFDRYVLSISPIPYIDYASYEYSVLAGPAFTIVYTVGGLCIALFFHSRSIRSIAVNGLSEPKNDAIVSKLNIVAVATLVFSASFTATAFALTFWQQCIIRMAMGLTQSVITPFSSSILSDLFPSDSKGAAFAIFNLGTYISFSLSLSLGLFIYDQYGWQAGYILFGIIGFLFAFVLPLLRFALSKNTADTTTTTTMSTTMSTTTESRLGDGGAGSRSRGQYKILKEGDEEGAAHSAGVVNPMLAASLVPVDEEAIDRDSTLSLIKTMGATLRSIATRWWNVSGVYTMSLATGIRLGGGYIWAGYTGVFYSSLFIQQSNSGDDTLTLSSSSSCSYSYNSNNANTTATAAVYSSAGVCSADYPYCVDGTCSALNGYPWHNVGMQSIQLEEYMAWVPLVGSGLGSLIGGLLSDFFIRKLLAARGHVEDDSNGDGLSVDEQKAEVKSSLIDYSDFLREKKRRPSKIQNISTDGLCLRAGIAGVGNLIAMPIVVYSFFMDFPGCFLVMICSGMVGELYFSQCLAIVTDSLVVPAELVAPSVGLFMFIITLIGGNFPILIPFFESMVGYDKPVTVQFSAANYKDDPSGGGVILFNVQNTDARKLQYSIVYVLALAYTVAGLLYLVSAFQFYLQGKAFRRENENAEKYLGT